LKSKAYEEPPGADEPEHALGSHHPSRRA